MPAKKRFAIIKDPVIQAVLGGHYAFANNEQAQKQLAIIKASYFISKHPEHKDDADTCTLWIRDYEVTEEQLEQGVIGNFLKIHCVKTAPNSFGFFCKKVDIDASVHPQRKRVQQRHPNWGHPILRSIERKRSYPTVDNAQAELTLLQQEYPHAAVPGPNKLYLMVFGRTDSNEKRVKKYVLEIKQAEKGYYIDCVENTPKPRTPSPKKPAPATGTAAEAPVGNFTAKLALKRNKKK
jgi:hypothetical protein